MEMVYVVERSVIFPDCFPQGFQPMGPQSGNSSPLSMVSSLSEGFFVQRTVAEKRPDWKQVIPYVIFHQNGKVWVMNRGENGGEKRLRNMRYIGVGGHVNPEDAEGAQSMGFVWEEAAIRELAEEAYVNEANGERHVWSHMDLTLIGFINDDHNRVGAVHLGMVYSVKIPDGWAVETEDEGRWEDIALVKDSDTGENETWTKLILEHLQ